MSDFLQLIRFVRALQKLPHRSILNETELTRAEKELDDLLKLDDESLLKIATRDHARTHTHTRAHIN